MFPVLRWLTMCPAVPPNMANQMASVVSFKVEVPICAGNAVQQAAMAQHHGTTRSSANSKYQPCKLVEVWSSKTKILQKSADVFTGVPVKQHRHVFVIEHCTDSTVLKVLKVGPKALHVSSANGKLSRVVLCCQHLPFPLVVNQP